MARARSSAPACRVSLIAGSRRATELDAPCLGCCKAGFGAVADHAAFLLRHRGIDADHKAVGVRHDAGPLGTLALPLSPGGPTPGALPPSDTRGVNIATPLKQIAQIEGNPPIIPMA